MVDFVYGASNFERRRGDFPALPIVNLLAENIPTEPGVTLQSRPGLSHTGNLLGSGPVRGLYKADGVLGNSLFAVSGNSVYVDSISVGSIVGEGPVSFAGYADYLFINAGEGIKSYDGTTLGDVSFPDGANVVKVVVGASRLIAIREDTGIIYWSDPLGITIDALDFAEAENSPDTLKEMLFQGDKLILFGAETIEFWQTTTDSDLPFAPLIGAALPIGVKGTGMAVNFNKSFAWITNNNEVCIGDPDNIVSEPELQVRIRENGDSTRLWTFFVDDNEYLAVRLATETWVYGARSQVWSKFESYGEDNWIPQCYDAEVFGSSTDGKLYEWSDTYLDAGSVMTRSFRAWLSLTGESVRVNNIIMRTNPGTTPYTEGEYADPVVSLRTSLDGGHSWHPWKDRSLGQQGQYHIKVFWSSLGRFGYPGILVEIRATYPGPFRVSGLGMNEPFGGV